MDTLTLHADPEVVELLDPLGDLRRAGKLDLCRVPISTDPATWTPRTLSTSFRVCKVTRRLYRKVTGLQYLGGCEIKSVSIDNPQLTYQWLNK